MTAWLLLAAALLLIVACGVFVAAEFSFVTVDRGTVERPRPSGDRAALGVQQALRSLSTQLSGAQVGITVTNLAIGFLAEPAIADAGRGPLDGRRRAGGAVGPIAVGDRPGARLDPHDALRRAGAQEPRAGQAAGDRPRHPGLPAGFTAVDRAADPGAQRLRQRARPPPRASSRRRSCARRAAPRSSPRSSSARPTRARSTPRPPS